MKPLNDEEREQAKIAANAILSGFRWIHSPEGEAFWSNVYDRLKVMAQYSERRSGTDRRKA